MCAGRRCSPARPGEQHDIGLLMLAVMLRADGWRVEYLGADTPVDAAVAFAERMGAGMLCLSAVATRVGRRCCGRPSPAVEHAGLMGDRGRRRRDDARDRAASSRRPTPTLRLDVAVEQLRTFAADRPVSAWLQAALAGAAAAAVWGLVEPIDRRLFGSPTRTSPSSDCSSPAARTGARPDGRCTS